jgi:hypothetical protein
MRDRGGLITVRQIEMMLRERVEILARELLPNGRKDQHHWRVGGLHGFPGNSLGVSLSGASRGMWADYVDPSGADMGGDCLDLIRLVKFGGDKGDAIKWARSWLGLDELDPARLAAVQADTSAMAAKRQGEEEREAAAKMKGARALWHHENARPIAGTPAEAYLEGRGISLAKLGQWPGSLKFHPEVWNREAGLKIPAMLAMAVTPQGKHVATHRTYLQRCPSRGWTKIDSPNAKMVLGKIGGGFVPLRKGDSGRSMANLPAGEPIVMTEGIEDALTIAMARPGARVIAAYSVGNMGAIVFPEAIGRLIIAADRDPPGSDAVAALERAIARQQSRAVKVQLVMPPIGAKDFNAWLTGNVAGTAEAAA